MPQTIYKGVLMWIRRSKYNELRRTADSLLDEVCSLRGHKTKLEITNRNLSARNETLRKRIEELEVALRFADDPNCDD